MLGRHENYIWQHDTWPDLTWDSEALIGPLARCRQLQGKLLGRLEPVGFQLSQEAYAEALIEEAVQTSCIEGEILDRGVPAMIWYGRKFDKSSCKLSIIADSQAPTWESGLEDPASFSMNGKRNLVVCVPKHELGNERKDTQ